MNEEQDGKRRRGRTLATALAAGTMAGILFTAVGRVEALPRYTARYEQKCALCHVNPSGGGLRPTYATQKLVPEEIAWRRAKPAGLEELEKTLFRFVEIGADFRQMYVGADVPEQHLNFYQMQADLYLAFQLDPKVSLVYDRGQSGNYELFGTGYVFPSLYLKAGRFIPSYGWKLDDHTQYVRSELQFMPPGNSDVGLEAGFSRGPVDVQIAVVNGNRGGTFDSDTQAAGVGNAIARHRIGPVGFSVGLSAYHHPGDAIDRDVRGLYGYLTLARGTWLWQVDRFRDEPTGAAGLEGQVTSHELTYLLRQGLELKATYDFFDPNRNRETGAKSRWGGGIFVMPYSYVTLEGLVRRIDYENGIEYSGRDYTETLIQLHLLY